MAISSYKTFLMKGTVGAGNAVTWEKLIDIKDYPDLGGERPQLDCTSLSDGKHKYIADIEDVDTLTFTANYDSADFATLKALKGLQVKYAIWLGGTVDESTGIATPTGSEGIFEFTGDLDVYKNGHGVSEVQDMTINVIVSDGPNFTENTPTTYGVTNTLTHVSNSNPAEATNGSYLGIITADSGYEISSVTVTMGASDVTSTVYNENNGSIYIPVVTGNLTIVATASAEG